MSERSMPKETLSINATICMRTPDNDLVTEFMDDLNQLLSEWQARNVQFTNLNIAIHDHRTFEEVKKLSEEDTE